MTSVELLLWSGCPSTVEARALLNKALAELEMAETPVTERYIEDYEVAQAECFVGSPSIRVNGREVIEGGETFGLTCRVYQKPDGRFSPLPEYAQVVEGIRRLSA